MVLTNVPVKAHGTIADGPVILHYPHTISKIRAREIRGIRLYLFCPMYLIPADLRLLLSSFAAVFMCCGYSI